MSRNQVRDSSYALEAAGLTAVLDGQRVLEIPSLRVNPSEVLMVIGPNGSGKTTLLLCLALLLKPATGVISYKGIPVVHPDQVLQLRRRIAVVFQEPLLLNSTVWDNVTMGLRLRKVQGDEIGARAQKWLERFGIAPLARRQAKTLSGGESKRVSLARAFALQPEAMFLDEPFTALDSPTRQALHEDFESVLRETNITTVMVTHDRNEALSLGHRAVVLMNGRVRQTGSPEEIFSSPIDEEVAGFVEIGNIPGGVVVSNQGEIATIDVNGRMVEAVSRFPAGERVFVCIRPEDVTLSLARTSSSARNCIAGEVTRVASSSPLCHIEIDGGFPLVALVTKKSAEEMGLKTGGKVYATFKATALHIIKRQK